MPYNTSRAVCLRNRRYYEDLDAARGTTISWPTGDLKRSQKLAARIREALAAAKHHPDFHEYADLKELYEIGATKGWVEARWKGEENYAPTKEGEAPRPKPMASRPQRMDVEEATTVTGVVGAAIKYKDRADELYCPNAVIEDEAEKVKLWKWCQKSGWKYIDQFEGGLTITRRPVDPLLVYEPEEEG